jgi:hypothetical protein
MNCLCRAILDSLWSREAAGTVASTYGRAKALWLVLMDGWLVLMDGRRRLNTIVEYLGLDKLDLQLGRSVGRRDWNEGSSDYGHRIS